MSHPLHVIILAAGQGSRMKSSLPKVLHAVAGKPMLHHVIDTARHLDAEGIHVVVGHGAEQVRERTPKVDIHWALQADQLGTGHAVAQALPEVPDNARVLVLYGDVPLISRSTLADLVRHVSDHSLALLTARVDDPSGYGRIVRDDSGFVQAIVEEKDASEAQKQIGEINTGILAAMGHRLKEWMPKLSSENAQGEYYLTDTIAMAVQDGLEISVAHPRTEQEVQGVNNRIQLAQLERWYQHCEAERLMKEGATLIDPARLDVRGELTVGHDVVIDVNCVFEGEVTLAENVVVGPNCLIRNAKIGPGSVIEANSVIDGAEAAGDNQIGPFARLRPGTRLARKAKVGNFVEIKKSDVGEGSKVNHLTYIGDTAMGRDVNVGAGTITCNYDGVNKYQTEIGDGCFIGSNSSLVAPVTLAAETTVGAGSTITKSVEKGQLAIARGRQRNIDGWQRPRKKDS